jgi:hypothetical protein
MQKTLTLPNRNGIPTAGEFLGELPKRDETLVRIRIVRRCFVTGDDGVNRPQEVGVKMKLPRWQALDIVAAGRGVLL